VTCGEQLEIWARRVAADWEPGNDPGDARDGSFDCCRHRPRRLTCRHDRTRREAGEHTSRERTCDEPSWFRGVYACAENVEEIAAKPVEGTAQ
jgi:hypothetical protein